MKKIIYIILGFIIISLSSCERVIDVDLSDADPAIVIEGNIGDSPKMAEVKIAKTSSYFDDSPGEKLSGAKVTIENEDGSSFILTESEKGIYQSEEVPFQVGKRYRLKVELENELYEGYSVLNPRVRIDSLSYFYEEGFAFIDEGYVLKVYMADPPGVDNYYRLKVLKNGEPRNSDNFFVFTDQYFDGQPVEISMRSMKFQPDDTVSAQLFAIDKNVFEFYSTFEDLMDTNPGSAAPANPNTNLSNGALGYFSAWSSDKKSIIIKVDSR